MTSSAKFLLTKILLYLSILALTGCSATASKILNRQNNAALHNQAHTPAEVAAAYNALVAELYEVTEIRDALVAELDNVTEAHNALVAGLYDIYHIPNIVISAGLATSAMIIGSAAVALKDTNLFVGSAVMLGGMLFNHVATIPFIVISGVCVAGAMALGSTGLTVLSPPIILSTFSIAGACSIIAIGHACVALALSR